MKTWFKGSAFLAMSVMLSHVGSQIKDPALVIQEAISISAFSPSKGDPNQALNEKNTSFVSYILNPLGRLSATCLKNVSFETTNQILFQGSLFLRVQTCRSGRDCFLQCCDPRLGGWTALFPKEKEWQIRQQTPVPSAGSQSWKHRASSDQTPARWNCQDLKAAP